MNALAILQNFSIEKLFFPRVCFEVRNRKIIFCTRWYLINEVSSVLTWINRVTHEVMLFLCFTLRIDRHLQLTPWGLCAHLKTVNPLGTSLRVRESKGDFSFLVISIKDSRFCSNIIFHCCLVLRCWIDTFRV